MLDSGDLGFDGMFGVAIFMVGEELVDGGIAINEYASAGVGKQDF